MSSSISLLVQPGKAHRFPENANNFLTVVGFSSFLAIFA